MMKKLLLTTALSCTLTLAGGFYDDNYLSSRSGIVHPVIETGIPNVVNVNNLMKKKTVFTSSLYFKRGVLTADSARALQAMLRVIKEKGSQSYYVTVIGHTSGYTDEDHIVPLSRWASFWKNTGYKRVSRDVVADEVNRRILSVYHQLKNDHVDAAKIYTENRMDRDPIATEATNQGREMNHRVDVALYY